jgi:catechol 2,3-dioxygenase-like lactoylglutathione lyase family enzyme
MTARPRLLVNIDVPDLERATRFYTEAFGLRVGRRIGPGAVELLGAEAPIYLLHHPAGTSPLPAASALRDYARHWTPVHIDLAVDSIDDTYARALAAGAVAESEIVAAAYGRIARLADPFGHGVCLIEFHAQGYDALV